MKEKIKDKKIRVLSFIAAMLSLFAVITVMFRFMEDYVHNIDGYGGYYVNIYGFELYTNTKLWWGIMLGVLGIISLLWNLIYGAYAIIDGKYRNLTWRIARYGYIFGVIVGIINFFALISYFGNTPNSYNYLSAFWTFLVFLAVIIALEIALIFLKDEDTKNKLNSDT